MKLKDLSKYERPREKMARYGVGKLSDHELLAIMLGSGTHGTNVIQLAKKIVMIVQKIGLKDLALGDLLSVKGLGPVKAGQVLAALEFGKRHFLKEPEVILTPEKVFELCSDIRGSKKEHFVAFYLNSRGVLIVREIISIGTLDASLVHPREVFEPALRHGAASIVVAHNHPSGSPEPSDADRDVTTRLKQVGHHLGIPLIHHIILTSISHRLVE